jgi:hypothetical protein
MSSSRSMNQQVPMIVVLVICSTASGAFATENRPLPSGHGVIRKAAGGSEIVITTTPRLAGAIHSLTWGGKEFIDSTDHGRQLQSAANFDVGTRFTAETFNPTEAGSRRDGSGTSSSSRLLHMSATKSALQTTTQMAFWLSPGEKSDGNLAKNKQVLSNHLLTKRVQIGHEDLANVVQYNVTFSVPIGERHNYAQFEAVTGYMPEEFSRFSKFNAKSGELESLSDGPGEQAYPVVLSTESGSHAMGVFSPAQPSPGYDQAGYGRVRFAKARVVKWNCVFRVRDTQGVEPGDYSFRIFVVVGDLAIVTKSLRALHRKFEANAMVRKVERE